MWRLDVSTRIHISSTLSAGIAVIVNITLFGTGTQPTRIAFFGIVFLRRAQRKNRRRLPPLQQEFVSVTHVWQEKNVTATLNSLKCTLVCVWQSSLVGWVTLAQQRGGHSQCADSSVASKKVLWQSKRCCCCLTQHAQVIITPGHQNASYSCPNHMWRNHRHNYSKPAIVAVGRKSHSPVV